MACIRRRYDNRASRDRGYLLYAILVATGRPSVIIENLCMIFFWKDARSTMTHVYGTNEKGKAVA